MFYMSNQNTSAASKFGQMIGESFEKSVISHIAKFLEEEYTDYEIMPPEAGNLQITLEMIGGNSKQMDTVITQKLSNDPLALLETKWLKDGRHHNDKGAWILQLKEVKKRYATIRGAAAFFAGYWTEGVGVMLMSEGGIQMVIVATDEQVYETLQPYVNEYTKNNNLESIVLEAKNCRKKYPRPWALANTLIDLSENELSEISDSWLNLVRETDEEGNQILGKDLINQALRDLLSPITEYPTIAKFEISLDISTGNIIFSEFNDYEELMDFIQHYQSNPENILDKITPKKNRLL